VSVPRFGRGRRRSRRDGSGDDQGEVEIVTVAVGSDAFRAQVIAEACRAEGLKVELLTSEMGARPTTVGVEQQLLVRAPDVEKVREILRRQESA
jgi:hypothetical protein